MAQPLVAPSLSCNLGTSSEIYSYIYDKINALFLQEGVDVVTDHDRAQIGLPPRGPDGWTNEEIIALERARIDAMMRPITILQDQID